jgi:carboxyl-terminal processing protease
MTRKRRHLVAIPLTLLAAALLGGLYGPRVGIASAASEDAVKASIEQFTKVLSVIESNYAETVDAEEAIFSGAIPNMLHVLDPHSQFFDPDAFRQLRDDQKGEYAGVGMQIGPRNGRTVVIAPFPKTPAYKAGLRPGDVIAEVNGESTDGLNTTEVAKRLRGPAGTEVAISIERRGADKLITVSVVRASIPRKSVPVSFMIQPEVGFVKIESFNETTGRELDEALEALGAGKLKGLILDLRGNRGGLLSEGVYVSDKFLEKGQAIVSHHGRASTRRSYNVRGGNQGVTYPMVVMVDCESASASEIVAGALQDHDRALVVGTPTFGKGLVQTVYPLGETSGLALTTARYYTPSGRLIQRRYDNVSLYDYYSDPCSEKYQPSSEDLRRTDRGRQVFGGGGITPDFRSQAQKFNDFQLTLARSFAFQTYAQEYTLQRPNLAAGWDATDLIIEDFRQFLRREEVEFQQVDFDQNIDYMKRMLKREVYVSAYDLDEGERVRFELDPDVQQALGLLPKAKDLLEGRAGSLVAERQ